MSYSLFKTHIDQPVGIYHAIIGTLHDHAGAAVIAVPDRHPDRDLPGRVRQARTGWRAAITFLVDVMTGIPSIVAGLFAFALFTVIFGPGSSSASAARWRWRC